MTSAREAFLQRVRQAVADGNRVAPSPVREPRGSLGTQATGPNPVKCFSEQLQAVGGNAHIVTDVETASRMVVDLASARQAHHVLLGRGSLLDSLHLRDRLEARKIQVTVVNEVTAANCREPFFSADIGVSGIEALVGETGTLVAAASPTEPRSLSLLPPVHIAIAEQSQVLSDLFDLFQSFASATAGRPGRTLPSCLSLITGPSKTGDIELRLVTGVHGPGEVHVIVVCT
jgi:L-lactate utilization protein LutC